jgi:DNA polymerase I-like protein with 3'-5' exonuclease and polymerase domains
MCDMPDDLDLQDVDTVAIDIETYDPNLKTKGLGAIRKDGFITGVAVATGKDTVYFGLHHSDKTTSKEEEKEFWDQLNKKLLQNSNIIKVFHNAIYDVCWLRSVTGKMLKGRLVDTMVAASVIDENRFKYSLDALSKDYLNDSKYKYDLYEKAAIEGIKDPMSNMHKLSYGLVKVYAKQDVDLTLKLWNLFNKKLDKTLYTKAENNKVYTCRNIFELETRLFPCLVDMKFKGVRIDTQKLEHLGKRLRRRRDNLLSIIKKHTGLKLQLWAATSIKQLLDNRKITKFEKTPKSGMPKLPKDFLKTHEDRFLRMVSKAREADKAVNTFIEGLKSYIYKGRIHADINQIKGDGGGTVTGRFSMSNPNLQQIPSKGYIGKKMRQLFIPEEGHTWGSFDYSQQEPRIVVHYAIKHGLSETEDLKERFDDDKADFHQVVADMAKISRKQAKTINLGLFYGMGKGKLQAELNLDKAQAKTLFDTYHRKVPFVKELSDNLIRFAAKHKLIFTLEDRFCRFDKYESVNKRWDNNKRKFQEWDPEAVEIKQSDGKIKYKGDWITPKLFTREEAWTKFKLLFNAKSKEKVEQLTEEQRQDWFKNYFSPAFTYKALNRLVQGSAADMTKKAMVLLYEKGIVPHIQIHDELCVSIKDQETRNTIQKIMETAITLEINNKVDYEEGTNWGNIK